MWALCEHDNDVCTGKLTVVRVDHRSQRNAPDIDFAIEVLLLSYSFLQEDTNRGVKGAASGNYTDSNYFLTPWSKISLRRLLLSASNQTTEVEKPSVRHM